MSSFMVVLKIHGDIYFGLLSQHHAILKKKIAIWFRSIICMKIIVNCDYVKLMFCLEGLVIVRPRWAINYKNCTGGLVVAVFF